MENPEDARISRLNDEFKQRVRNILGSMEDKTPLQQLQELNELGTEQNPETLIRTFKTRVGTILSKSSAESLEAQDAAKKVACERLILLLQQKGFATRKGDTLILDTEKLAENDSKASFRRTIENAIPKNQNNSDIGDSVTKMLFRELQSYIKVVDMHGKEVNYNSIIKTYASYSKWSGERVQEVLRKKVKEYLKSKKAVRLWLKNPREELTPEEVIVRKDNDNGFLCVFNAEKNVYSKLSLDHMEEAIMSKDRAKLENLFNDPEIDLRRTDIKTVNFMPRLFGPNNTTPLLDNIKYYFPTAEFTIPHTEEKLTIDPERDTYVKLSDEYGALIINRGSTSTPYLHKLASRKELEHDPVHKENLEKKHQTRIGTRETTSRLSEWDITQFLTPFSHETPQEYARRAGKIQDIAKLTSIYRELIDEADFDLQQYDLKKQLLFAAFYAGLTATEKKEVHTLLSTFREDFINAIESCEYSLSMGRVVVEMLRRHGVNAIPILRHFEQLALLMKEKEKVLKLYAADRGKAEKIFDEGKFYSSILKRGVQLLQEVATLHPGTDLEKYLEGAKQYETDVIAQGALFVACSSMSKKDILPPEQLNDLMESMKVSVVDGGKLVKSAERPQMAKKQNYPSGTVFNENDYAMVVENLKQTYGKIDKGWQEYLIDNIPRDLNNPKVRFIMLRDQKMNKLIGLCKIKEDPDEPGAYYFGTHYVNPEYQRVFNIGEYLQKMAEKLVPEGAKIVATVAVSNPSVQRHIERHDGIGVAMVHEADEKNSSDDLIKFEWHYEGEYFSKNEGLVRKEDIINVAEKKSLMPPEWRREALVVRKFDTTAAGKSVAVQEMKNLTAQGYVMTRFFYSNANGKDDLRSTYVVFEKSKRKALQMAA